MIKGMRRVALVTCAELPHADSDTHRLIAPLAATGVVAHPVVWDDPNIDWDIFDLAVIRSCWDYASRRAEFLAWAGEVPKLANSSEVLTWNTDKRYLAELRTQGINVVQTDWVQPNDEWCLPEPQRGWSDCVVKPAVSLAALDTGRYNLRDDENRRLACAHVRRLQDAGRVVMVQPYVAAVDTEGETSVVFIAGKFSHAIRKEALLDGPDRGVDRRFVPSGGQVLRRCEPTEAQLQLADRALAAVPCGREELLYARVDMVSDNDGAPVIMELELTEPSLYLTHTLKGAQRFAWAIAARVWKV